MMLIDSYGNMIVRFKSPATRGFLSPVLSLSSLVSLRRKKTSGPGYRIATNSTKLSSSSSLSPSFFINVDFQWQKMRLCSQEKKMGNLPTGDLDYGV